MRLLLDTHVLLWALGSEQALSSQTRATIEDPGSAVFVSPVSPWEIEIKRAAGRLVVRDDYVAKIEESGFAQLPISIDHAVAAAGLPPHHRDPFDRMLVAQARLEQLTIVTRDRHIARYDVEVMEA